MGMTLQALGFDAWFQDQQAALGRPDCSPVRVTAVDRDRYLVRNASDEIPAELAGSFRFAIENSLGFPCVGDWVVVQYTNAGRLAIVCDILPRKSLLRRKTPYRTIDYQAIAANVGVAFLVQSCDANFNLRRLERYRAMVLEAHIRPAMLLTKIDLVHSSALRDLEAQVRAANIECEVIAVSSQTGDGLDDLRRMLVPGETYCLLGSSGVGKTTILNRLIGQAAFATGVVRSFDGKGRHITARRQLTVLETGAMLIDTPGMRELGALGLGDGIAEEFADIVELATRCRFRDCSHADEPGCAVRAAVEQGDLNPGRCQSYLKLLRESEHLDASYAERRRRDRDFGRRIHAATKHRPK
jgi:ribosome biogenesis GTPase